MIRKKKEFWKYCNSHKFSFTCHCNNNGSDRIDLLEAAIRIGENWSIRSSTYMSITIKLSMNWIYNNTRWGNRNYAFNNGNNFFTSIAIMCTKSNYVQYKITVMSFYMSISITMQQYSKPTRSAWSSACMLNSETVVNHKNRSMCRQITQIDLSMYSYNTVQYTCYSSVHENHWTHQTFLMARPKCLMRDFTNLNRIYKAHQTNVWWIMKVFQVHCYSIVLNVLKHDNDGPI